MRRLLFLIIIFGINLNTIQAKKEGELSAIFADTIINNGWVVLHGRLLEKPYHFHLDNDTFWINGFQYLPSPPDPLQKPPEWVPEYTELGKWYFEISEVFADSCQRRYKRWRRKLGAASAMDSLLHYIDTQNLIKVRSLESIGDNCIDILFDYRQLDLISNPTPRLIDAFTKPGHEYVGFSLMLWCEIDEDTTWVPPTQGEIFLNTYKRLKDLLTHNTFLYLYYGGGWCEYGRVRGRESDFIDLIKEILAKPISESQMIKELYEKANLDSLESIYIIYNRDSWFDSKAGKKEE